MKGFVFDPSRLARPPKQLERDGCAMAARLLREYLGGGGIFAAGREQARRDPRLREMLAVASEAAGAPSQAVRRTG